MSNLDEKSDRHNSNDTDCHDHYGLVGDCAGCDGQMIETTCLETSEERRVTLECQDCGTEAELRHDFEDGLEGGSWSGVGNPEFKPLNWIQCSRCYGHGYVEDPICDLRRAMNGREHPCPNCHTSGKVPRVVETDGGTDNNLLRCTKCNAPLAATEADKDGFEIPLCRGCHDDVLTGGESA